MSWMHTAQFALPECFLDVSAMRQTIVSSSVANVDTPGYHV
jgi:flagellar basal body rod protein FlgB